MWEAKETEMEKSCDSCANAKVNLRDYPCNACFYQGSRPGWQPAHSYAAAVEANDGSTATYYELPHGATQLQDLISFKNMNAQVGEAFRSLYRYDDCPHSDKARNCRKVIYYMEAELARLAKYE